MLGILGFALAALAALAVANRLPLAVLALTAGGAPELLEPADEGSGVRWVDDYFTVEALDAQTWAIGEPRYYQQNYSYLIAGASRAVLFDAGPGHRDMRPVVASLTDLPVTFVPSHFHYDHVGNEITFDRVAVVDLPYLRKRAPDDELTLVASEHLGSAEGFDAPTLRVDEWLAPGSAIDLGGRTLHVLYTPGHTEDSISLLDLERQLLFSGDFIYPGPLFAFLSNSGLGDYLQGAETVLHSTSPDARIYGAHRVEPPGAPELAISDVEDLRRTLVSIQAGDASGSGLYPVSYTVNERVELLADMRWFHEWTVRHPEFRVETAD